MDDWWPGTGVKFYHSVQSLLSDGASQIALASELLDLWARRRALEPGAGSALVTFSQNGADYLFDGEANDGHGLTVAAMGFPSRPSSPRDEVYQAGCPLAMRPGRPTDRGHMFPNSAGGQFGPNLFRQDRALNRGLSKEGRLYRSVETAAVTNQEFFFCALVYCDDSDFPAVVELGIVRHNELEVFVFRNRFDTLALAAFPPPAASIDALRASLAALTTAQIGDVGEETARAWLEIAMDATPVTLGDSRMERTGHLQDLDMTVLLGDELVAIEVKTRYFAAAAGRLTRSGNLPRPRLGSNAAKNGVSERQGSSSYASRRLSRVLERPNDGRITTMVVAVDLSGMFIQGFMVSDAGKLIPRTLGASDCASYVSQVVEELFGDGMVEK